MIVSFFGNERLDNLNNKPAYIELRDLFIETTITHPFSILKNMILG